MYPAAVDFDLENWRKQTRKGPIEAVIGGIATFDGEIQSGKIRHNCLVGHGRLASMSLYGTASWVRRSRMQLRIEPLCRMCLERNQVVPATVADHIIPHKGDLDAFYHGELQSLMRAVPYQH